MPSEVAREWPAVLRRIRLVEVANNFDGVAGGHEKPPVLFRLVPCVRRKEREKGQEQAGSKPATTKKEAGKPPPHRAGGARGNCPNPHIAPRPEGKHQP